MTVINGNTNVVLKGRGEIILRPSDHIATGGEGEIFLAAKTAVKIYLDPRKMIAEGITDKISLLSRLGHPYIVAPKGIVTNTKGDPIGFYMPYMKGEPLPRIFTNDFRTRERFGDDDASVLVDRMRDVVSFAHREGALLVDANELNWLALFVKGQKPEPRIIDVDSWAIGRWPATVVMPSIRDHHTHGFNRNTDWFSWGVVTFQVYTGIHPYKGTVDGFKKGDLEARMRANVSVFSDGVRLNRAVRDFSRIPGPLLDWYIAVFQNGERGVPPSPFGAGVATATIGRVARVIATQSGVLVFTKLFGDGIDKVVRVFPSGVVLLESGKLVDLSTKREIGSLPDYKGEVVRVPKGWLTAYTQREKIILTHINEVNFEKQELGFSVRGQRLVRYENRIFAVIDKGLLEIKLNILHKPIASAGNIWGVMVNATRWFDGVGVQEAMGASYLIAPFGEEGCAHIRVPEIDELKVVEAKAGHRFISIIGIDTRGAYHKIELAMEKDYNGYKIWKSLVDTTELNVAILPKGVRATITTDGGLDVFVPSSGTVNKIADDSITTDMILAHWGDKVVYIKDGVLSSVRM